MTYQLPIDEKINIINGRLKNIEASRYDTQLSIDEENAVESPSTEILANHASRLADLDARKAVLEAKLVELS